MSSLLEDRKGQSDTARQGLSSTYVISYLNPPKMALGLTHFRTDSTNTACCSGVTLMLPGVDILVTEFIRS